MASSPPSNALREGLEAGETLLGVLDSAYSPTLVEFYGHLGLDFVWIDLEHGGPSPRDADAVEQLLRAAELGGTELLIRLPSSDPSLIRKALDAGVRSLFLPRTESADEVRRAVRAARFEYDGQPGQRGLAAPRARRWGLADDYVRREDEQVLVGTTIETTEAVEDVEAILDVPDLGFVFAGPLDLSVGVGHPGELDHPDVEEHVETIREAALDAGVPLGGLGFSPADVTEKADRGYQLLNVGSTTGALKATVTGWLDDIER